MAVMVERPVVRGRILHGTSMKRKRRRCNTTSASISGYSSGKLLAENLQRAAVHAHEAGRRIVYGLPRMGRSTARKKRMPSLRMKLEAPSVGLHEARPDDHLAAGGLQRFENARDIARRRAARRHPRG